MFVNWQSHVPKDITSPQIIFLIKSEHTCFVEPDKLILKSILSKKEPRMSSQNERRRKK